MKDDAILIPLVAAYVVVVVFLTQTPGCWGR
jgi:hypothetical protein